MWWFRWFTCEIYLYARFHILHLLYIHYDSFIFIYAIYMWTFTLVFTCEFWIFIFIWFFTYDSLIFLQVISSGSFVGKWFLHDSFILIWFIYFLDSFLYIIHLRSHVIFLFDAIHLVSIWFVLFKWFTNCHMIFTHDSFMIYFFRYVSFLYTWR